MLNQAFGEGVILLKDENGTEYKASFDADYAWALEQDMRKVRKMASNFPEYTGGKAEGSGRSSPGFWSGFWSGFLNFFRKG